MRMRTRLLSVIAVMTLLLGVFCLPVAAEVTYTEMPITGVYNAGTGNGHWRITLTSTGTMPASGFYSGLSVELTGISTTNAQVYNTGGKLMLILWGSGTTAADGDTVTVKAGSATSNSDATLGITIPKDYVLRYNGTSAAWELQIETTYTDMEVTSFANAYVADSSHWRVNLNVSEAFPTTGFYTGLEVEVTGITATARQVYNNSGYLMLILWGSGTTVPDGATVTLKAGSATSDSDTSLGIRIAEDYTIRYNAATDTWAPYVEVSYTETKVSGLLRSHTDNGHWRFWLQMSTAMPTVNGAAFHEYSGWDLELDGLTSTDPRIYSDSGYLLIVLNGSGTEAPADGSTLTLNVSEMINGTDASVGVRLTEQCVLTYDADAGSFVFGAQPVYTELTATGVASAGTGQEHWRINLTTSATLPASGFYTGLQTELSGISASNVQVYNSSGYLMLILWGSGTTATDGATITLKAGEALSENDALLGIRLTEDAVLRYSESAGTWVQQIDNTPKEFTFTAVDENSGFTETGDYELWLTPSVGMPGEMNGTTVYSGLTASINGGEATAATLTKTDTGALKLTVPAASVPSVEAWTVTVYAGTAVSGDFSLPLTADVTAYVNQYGAYAGQYIQDCGTDVTLTYVTDNKQYGFYLNSTDTMPSDSTWATPIYAADEPESGVFLNGVKTRVYVKKITATQYYVCLNDAKVSPEVGDTVVISGRFDLDGNTVSFATHVYTFNGADASPVWTQVSTASQPIALKELCYNLDADEYAVLENRADGGETVITHPGDHAVTRRIGGVTFTQNVAVYRDGDLNLDNVVDIRDAVLKKIGAERTGAAAAADTVEERGIRLELLGEKPTKADAELPTAILGQTGAGTYITSLVATENGTTVFGVSDSNSGYTPAADAYDDYGFDYVFDFDGDRELRVLQLSDTQIIDSAQDESGRLSDAEVAMWTQDKIDELLFNCLDAAVEQAQPDIILITGDLNYGEFDGDGWCMQTLIAHMEGLKIPWAPIFGNHDNEGVDGTRTTIAMQCGWLEDATYCLFNQRHNIGGNGNYTIALSQNGELVRTIYMLDSNYCTVTDDPDQTVTVGSDGTRYTFLGFTEAQMNWLYAMGLRTNQLAGKTIPSFVCYHVPSAEFLDGAVANAYQTAEDSSSVKYTIGTDVTANSGDSGYKGGKWGTTINSRYLLPTLQKIGADGVFCGHQHVINTSFYYAGIRWTMGLKTGEYCDFPKEMGGTLATVSADGSSFTIERIVTQIAD